ncbi:MAG: hypothetical protein ACLRX6_03395 [Limosilactobacillus pontis]
MKVKIINDPKAIASPDEVINAPSLDKVINDFIKNKKVIDIKYQF